MRHLVEAPIGFESGEGTTRDLSTSGVFFVTPSRLEVGDTLRFSVELGSRPTAPLSLRGSGTVTRVERLADSCGVAMSVREFFAEGSRG